MQACFIPPVYIMAELAHGLQQAEVTNFGKSVLIEKNIFFQKY